MGLLNSKSLQVSLGGKPMWITGFTMNNQQLWTVALDDGTIELIITEDRKISSHNKKWKKIPAGAPPVFGINCNGEPILINELVTGTAPFAAPLPLADNKFAYISNAGDLVISSEKDTVSLSINAMHDSRILKDKNRRLLVLTNPVQYYHGVLGDHTEARGIAIIETTPQIKVHNQFFAPDSSVIEGVGAIWEDLNGDGKLEIAVTLSNNEEGTGGKHVIFNENGKVLASGQSIKPDGWRHLLLTFKIPEYKNALLAAIQKPHVDRLLNIYKWEGDSLIPIAQLHGFSTHIGGSRNLDGVLGTDISNDGHQEILLPCTTHDTLYAVSFKDSGLERIWNSPIHGISTTNIAHVGKGRHAAIALGTDQNIIEIWFSE
ncbi:MAG: hypothetical protein E4G94_08015 [ANME-2 cluster archaeon]|nr:MAG: hypothetical protein E4G94_08015 [ANME-2 cluster archaeon]